MAKYLWGDQQSGPANCDPEYAIEADSAEEALEKLKKSGELDAYQSDMEEGDETYWVDITVQNMDDEEDEAFDTIAIDPVEPDCIADEHDWQSPIELVGGCEENPGVYGHGGGVIINAICANCGAKRITDTWAQRMDNGEQGLESVKYEKPDSQTEEWVSKNKFKQFKESIEENCSNTFSEESLQFMFDRENNDLNSVRWDDNDYFKGLQSEYEEFSEDDIRDSDPSIEDDIDIEYWIKENGSDTLHAVASAFRVKEGIWLAY